MRTQARFPGVGVAAGHYESFYVKATAPGGGRGLWLRHTVHKPPDATATASLWLTVFDAGAGRPRAVKVDYPATELRAGSGSYIEVAAARLEPGRATGSLSGDGVEASWDLRFSDLAEPLHHLPYERLYRARVPRTKLLSPHPVARFDGELLLDGERLEIDAWPGMIGHNWGSEHAEQWVWIQASGLGGREGDYLDVAAGRIKLGPLTTPWVANGQIVLDGEPLRIGGLDRIYGTELDPGPDGCDVVLPGRRVAVRGRVGAPAERFVSWRYTDPGGGGRDVVNCSISDIGLEVDRPGHRTERLELAGVAAYEHGAREAPGGRP